MTSVYITHSIDEQISCPLVQQPLYIKLDFFFISTEKVIDTIIVDLDEIHFFINIHDA